MIREITTSQLANLKGQGFDRIFQETGALLIRGFWNAEENKKLAKGILAFREEWRHFPGFYDYSALGCPLYAYRCAEKQDEYFEDIKRDDRLIQEHFPRLEPALRELFETLQFPEKIRKKKHFGGPGFVIQNEKSTHEAHFDQDEAVLISRAKFPGQKVMFTLVGMIQRPERGGRLMLWDREPQPQDTEEGIKQYCRSHPPRYVDYREGDLLLLNGMKLHLIEPCHGERITVVLHFLKNPLGQWEYWF